MSDEIRVLFAPDWRNGVPYQTLLASALTKTGVKVSFLNGYRRVMPLSRLCRAENFDVLHLHWPEAYFPRKGDVWDWYRNLRFRYDLKSAVRGRALVVTAHNLHAHNRGEEYLAQSNYEAAFRLADAVIAHSEAARTVLCERFRLIPSKVHVIPHGDLSVTLGPRPERQEARNALGVDNTPVCLMFGAIEPYKGIEEAVAFWKQASRPARLVIAGKPISEEYANAIRLAVAGANQIDLHPRRVSDEELHRWLVAADCVLFNYRTIFTSGAACLARSLGKPILLSSGLTTIDLGEPTRNVFRFTRLDGAFLNSLEQALLIGDDETESARWKEITGWTSIARKTVSVYRSALDLAEQPASVAAAATT